MAWCCLLLLFDLRLWQEISCYKKQCSVLSIIEFLKLKFTVKCWYLFIPTKLFTHTLYFTHFIKLFYNFFLVYSLIIIYKAIFSSEFCSPLNLHCLEMFAFTLNSYSEEGAQNQYLYYKQNIPAVSNFPVFISTAGVQ